MSRSVKPAFLEAKRALVKQLGIAQILRSGAPVLHGTCTVCDAPVEKRLDVRGLQLRFNHPVRKFPLHVAILGKRRKVIGILEVLFDHIDPTRREKLMKLGRPWMAIDGRNLTEAPALLPVVDGDAAVVCWWCDWESRAKGEYDQSISEWLERVSNQTGIPVPDEHYETRLHRCWSCKGMMLAFTWDGYDSRHCPEPRPPTLILHKKVWLNCCPQCDAPQKNKFLYEVVSGTFAAGADDRRFRKFLHRKSGVGEMLGNAWRRRSE